MEYVVILSCLVLVLILVVQHLGTMTNRVMGNAGRAAEPSAASVDLGPEPGSGGWSGGGTRTTENTTTTKDKKDKDKEEADASAIP
jgi:hypothetical protein